MKRREISGAFLAAAPLLLAKSGDAAAQTCTPPCFQQTPEESAAGVSPSDTSIPSHRECGYVLLDRYGGRGDGTTVNDTAFAQAILVAGQFDGIVGIKPGTWRLNSQLSLGTSGKGARIVGLGCPTLKFYSVASTLNCVELGGDSYRQIELRNLVIDCSQVGLDGVVLRSGDHPIIDNVVVKSTGRDGFAIQCTSYQWVENGEFDLTIVDAGRHGVALTLSGSNGSFINECLWKQLEIRGISRLTSGGLMIFFNGLAANTSKFGGHLFLKSNFDAQYSGGYLPSSNIVESGGSPGNLVENPIFVAGGWENTGTGSIPAGYVLATSGGGIISLPSLIGIVLSGVGGLGTGPNVTSSPLDARILSSVSIGTNSTGFLDFPLARWRALPSSFPTTFLLRLTHSQYTGSGNVILRGYHILVRPDGVTVVATQAWDGSSPNEIASISFSIVNTYTLRVTITTGSAHATGGGFWSIYGVLEKGVSV